jgi:hypothetical protein
VLDDVGDGRRHSTLPIARLVAVDDARQRPGVGEGGGDRVDQA